MNLDYLNDQLYDLIESQINNHDGQTDGGQTTTNQKRSSIGMGSPRGTIHKPVKLSSRG